LTDPSGNDDIIGKKAAGVVGHGCRMGIDVGVDEQWSGCQ
jgi:hypothetical protein